MGRLEALELRVFMAEIFLQLVKRLELENELQSTMDGTEGAEFSQQDKEPSLGWKLEVGWSKSKQKTRVSVLSFF